MAPVSAARVVGGCGCGLLGRLARARTATSPAEARHELVRLVLGRPHARLVLGCAVDAQLVRPSPARVSAAAGAASDRRVGASATTAAAAAATVSASAGVGRGAGKHLVHAVRRRRAATGARPSPRAARAPPGRSASPARGGPRSRREGIPERHQDDCTSTTTVTIVDASTMAEAETDWAHDTDLRRFAPVRRHRRTRPRSLIDRRAGHNRRRARTGVARRGRAGRDHRCRAAVCTTCPRASSRTGCPRIESRFLTVAQELDQHGLPIGRDATCGCTSTADSDALLVSRRSLVRPSPAVWTVKSQSDDEPRPQRLRAAAGVTGSATSPCSPCGSRSAARSSPRLDALLELTGDEATMRHEREQYRAEHGVVRRRYGSFRQSRKSATGSANRSRLMRKASWPCGESISA